LRRAALALIPGYLAYHWGKSTREELVWGKSKYFSLKNKFLFFLCKGNVNLFSSLCRLSKVCHLSWTTPTLIRLNMSIGVAYLLCGSCIWHNRYVVWNFQRF